MDRVARATRRGCKSSSTATSAGVSSRRMIPTVGSPTSTHSERSLATGPMAMTSRCPSGSTAPSPPLVACRSATPFALRAPDFTDALSRCRRDTWQSTSSAGTKTSGLCTRSSTGGRRARARSRSRSKARPGSESRRSGAPPSTRRAGGGLRVLSSRPAESERGLAHAGLGDLFDGVARRRPAGPDAAAAPGTRGRAPASRTRRSSGRHAGARRRGSQRAWSCSPRTGSSSRSTISSGSTPRPRARSGSRFGGCPRRACCSLWTRRLDAGEQTIAVENALDAGPDRPVRVGPLSVGATHQLVRGRLSPHGVTRPTLLRLHEASGGNPFYALELARRAGCRRRARRSDAAAARFPSGWRSSCPPGSTASQARRARRSCSRLRDGRLTRGRARPRWDRAERTRAGARRTGDRARATAASGSRTRCSPRSSTRGCPAAERQRAHRRARGARRRSARPRPSPRALDRRAGRRARCDARAAPRRCRSPGRADRRGRARRARASADAGRRPRATLDRRRDRSRRALHHRGGRGRARRRLSRSELVARAAPGPSVRRRSLLLAEVESDEHRPRDRAAERGAARAGRAGGALRASIHRRLGLYVRFTRGTRRRRRSMRARRSSWPSSSTTTALRAAALAGLALVRFNAGKRGSARARRAGVRARRGAVRQQPRRRRLRARARPRLVRASSSARAPLLERPLRATGASATSGTPRTRSGISRSSSSAPGRLSLRGRATPPQSRELERPVHARRGGVADEPMFPLGADRRRTAATSRGRASSPSEMLQARRAARHAALRRPRRCSASSSSGAGTPRQPSTRFAAAERITRPRRTGRADNVLVASRAGRGAARARPRRRRGRACSTPGRRRRAGSSREWVLARRDTLPRARRRRARRRRGRVALLERGGRTARGGRRPVRARRARCSRSASPAGGRGRSGRPARRSRRRAPASRRSARAAGPRRARAELGRDRRPDARSRV